MSIKNICRWVISDAETANEIALAIPGREMTAEAVEFIESGVRVKLLARPADGSKVVFPELHIWDDPSRSEVLLREGDDWQEESTLDLLRQWERVRLEQFLTHVFPHVDTMHVVYRQWPIAEPTHFHHNGKLYQGWRIEMIAAVFAGFDPRGLAAFEFKRSEEADKEPEPEAVEGKAKLKLVQ